MWRNHGVRTESAGFAHIAMACPDCEWPSLSEASQRRRIEPATDMLGELLWGPISEADARVVGAHSPTATVLLRPVLDQAIHKLYVRACFEQCQEWTRLAGSAMISDVAGTFDEVDFY